MAVPFFASDRYQPPQQSFAFCRRQPCSQAGSLPGHSANAFLHVLPQSVSPASSSERENGGSCGSTTSGSSVLTSFFCAGANPSWAASDAWILHALLNTNMDPLSCPPSASATTASLVPQRQQRWEEGKWLAALQGWNSSLPSNPHKTCAKQFASVSSSLFRAQLQGQLLRDLRPFSCWNKPQIFGGWQ